MRGIPSYNKQEELNSNKSQIETILTAKAEVVKGDIKFTKRIEDIVYDTKPVKYISMVS